MSWRGSAGKMIGKTWANLAIRLSGRARGQAVELGIGNASLSALPSIVSPAIVRDIDDALSTGEMYLAYQPKLCLRSGNITGVEALIRWQHRLLGNIPPNQFIAHVERSGRICDLTLWVLARALADNGRLHERGFQLTTFINVSSMLLTETMFVAAVGRLASQLRGRIGFEITETSFIDNHDVAMANLRRFVAMGIDISIDDYGSGQSSLTYLKEFPAAELKIDRLFIGELASCHRNPLIVRSTIDLAHALEMRVVAEGVESLAALALLRAMGCDLIQGYILSRPLPIVALERFLASGEHTRILQAASGTIDAPISFWSRDQQALEAPPLLALVQ